MLFSEVATGHSFPAASAAIFLCHCPLVETKKKGPVTSYGVASADSWPSVDLEAGGFFMANDHRIGWRDNFTGKPEKNMGKSMEHRWFFLQIFSEKKTIHWGSWDSCEGNSCIYWTWIIDGLIMNIWWLMIVYSAFILSLFCVYSGLIEY